MRVLGVTLARAGSKRVPGKNIRLLGGKPLLGHTISEAQRSRTLDEYIVSTDSEEIGAIAESMGARVPFLRPPELATDSSSSVAALQHAVQFMEEEAGFSFDYVVELMATNPFKTAEDIDACVELLVESGAASVIAVHEVGDEHPARVKKIDEFGRLSDFGAPEPLESRRQDLHPRAFIRSGAIYALRRDELVSNGRRYCSEESLPYILPSARSLNIDSELDWKLAEVLLEYRESSD